MEDKEKPKYTMKRAMGQRSEAKHTMQNYMHKHPLVTLKMFYFFAFSSFVLKVIYMPLYFKQIGLPASYVGVLAGLPPFIRGGGAFFLGFVADKMKKRRILFLISLVANMILPLLCLIPRVKYPVCDIELIKEPVTDPLRIPLESGSPQGSVKAFPPHTIIDIRRNLSTLAIKQVVNNQSHGSLANNQHSNYEDSLLRKRMRRSTVKDLVGGKGTSEGLGIFELYRRTYGRRSEMAGKRKQEKLENVKNKPQEPKPFMADKKKPQKSHETNVNIFVILLGLITFGEFLGGPLRSLADMCVLETMGEDKSNYGDVALWLSVGKLILAPTILLLIRSFPLHICDKLVDNYEYSLYPLTVFSAFSMIFAFSMKFNEEHTIKGEYIVETHPDKDKQLIEVIFTFKTFTILVISFCFGALCAVHYTFVFWYITDLNPKDSAVVIAVVIVLRDIAASISYKLSGRALLLFGPINILHVAILLLAITFLSYAVMINPWFAIIPEVLYITVFSLAYSCFVVYLGNNTPPHLNATVQGIYQLLYNGVGFGCGPILAGFLFERLGGANTFWVFSGISFVLLLFSLCSHAITCILDKLNSNNYKPIPDKDGGDDDDCNDNNADDEEAK